MIRGIRGAITVEHNDADEMVESTRQLVEEMIRVNDIKPHDVSQVLMSVTNDLDAVFPAKALRLFEGWDYVPVMCTREIPVQNSLELCIRVMMTVNTLKNQEEINHVYLRDAQRLRPDLSQ